MNICDTFMKQYYDNEFMKTVLQIDVRTQIEVPAYLYNIFIEHNLP